MKKVQNVCVCSRVRRDGGARLARGLAVPRGAWPLTRAPRAERRSMPQPQPRARAESAERMGGACSVHSNSGLCLTLTIQSHPGTGHLPKEAA